MKTRYKVISYVLAWLLALFSVDFSFGLWALAWMFPLGLFAFFFPEHRQQAGWTVMIVSVAIYVVQAVFYFRARSLRATILWFALLVVLLTCTASGCHQMVHVH